MRKIPVINRRATGGVEDCHGGIRILSISFEMERPPIHDQDFSENDPRSKTGHVINLTQTT